MALPIPFRFRWIAFLLALGPAGFASAMPVLPQLRSPGLDTAPPADNRSADPQAASVLPPVEAAVPEAVPEITAERGPQFGPATRIKWRVACQIAAKSGAASNIVITMPVPQDWPGQSVLPGKETVPPETAALEIRDLPRAPRQVVARLPLLSAGSSAVYALDYDVEVRTTLPPADPALYRIPEKLEKEMKHWLEDSPGIRVRDARIRNAAAEALDSSAATDWERVDSIRHWINSNIQPDNEIREETTDTLRKKTGTAESRHRLFVALCRASRIPARLVWSDTNDHAEFYLEDDRGDGHWFPCHLSPAIALGSNPRALVILQKGDHFLVPEKKREEINFVTGFVSARGTAKPAVGFIEGPIIE